MGDDPEESAGFVEVEALAMLHAKNALAAPALAAQLLHRVNDDSEKCLPAAQFGDQLLRRTKIEGRAVHSVSPRGSPLRNSDTARGRVMRPQQSPRLSWSDRF